MIKKVKEEVKKAVTKKAVTPVIVKSLPVENKPFVKGPQHIVKDGEVILDPKFANPGVFSA